MNKYPSNEWNKETDEAVFFYTPDFYAFDNFSAFRVSIWGRDFQTSEHAYQWKKFSDSAPEIAEQIFTAPSPNETKNISDANKPVQANDWQDTKVSVMEEILRAKLEQHDKVRRTLVASGGKEIIENSPTDDFWGIGPDGTGQNTLGKLWMKLRSEIL